MNTDLNRANQEQLSFPQGLATHIGSVPTPSWIDLFHARLHGEFLCKVPLSFIDEFNTQCLQKYVKEFSLALNVLLGADVREYITGDDHRSQVMKDTQYLYCLIHNRFAKSQQGIDLFIERMETMDGGDGFGFGFCTSVGCVMRQADGNRSPLLPIGLSDKPRVAPLCVFCPMCKDVYKPTVKVKRLARIDGAYYGPSFPHILQIHLLKKQTDAHSLTRISRILHSHDSKRGSIVDEQKQQGSNGNLKVAPPSRLTSGCPGGTGNRDIPMAGRNGGTEGKGRRQQRDDSIGFVQQGGLVVDAHRVMPYSSYGKSECTTGNECGTDQMVLNKPLNEPSLSTSSSATSNPKAKAKAKTGAKADNGLMGEGSAPSPICVIDTELPPTYDLPLLAKKVFGFTVGT